MPADIVRPDYALLGVPSSPKRTTVVKSADEIDRMRRASRAAADVLERLLPMARPGVTTDELDAACHDMCVAHGGYPSPLNYHGYPKSLCTSVNEVICHGIPDDRRLRDGDIVNLDVTIFLDGMHGDTSATVLVGDVDPVARRLVEVTQQCLEHGIAVVRPGAHVHDIGRAIEKHAHAHGYGVVEEFVGHGIGDQFHMLPNVPHYAAPDDGMELVAGMTFTIEPMITIGAHRSVMWDDGWTAVTSDLSLTAQFEHTVLVTDDGVDVLTRRSDERIVSTSA